MIKTIQKKFILTAMTAITVMIIVLVGGINIFNISSVSRQSKRMLDFLTKSTEPIELAAPVEIGPPENPGLFNLRPPVEDIKQAALYFKVSEDGSGEIINIDVSRIPSVSEEKAKEIYSTITDNEGMTWKFLYKAKILPDNTGREIFFLSLSEQSYSLFRVALQSLMAGAVCWGLMLLFIIMLSRRAICPIAENFEKQKRFVTDAGHEIKTPLAIIMANTEALELHNGTNKWTLNIKNQILRLNGLMQNLLLLAKTDESESKARKEDVDLSGVFAKTAESFTESAKQRNLTFENSIESGIIIKADRAQITSLVSILIDNAVKYAAENSSIEIALKKDKSVLLSVKNKCTALPDCEPNTLFDRFYRGDSARTQKSGGFGIGLSSAKAIAGLNGGEIAAKYLPENTICFEIKF